VKIREVGEQTIVLAMHDGYSNRGVVHWRGLLIERAIGFLVCDILCGASHHSLAAHWHCGAEVRKIEAENRFIMEDRERLMSLEVRGADASIIKGDFSPIMGWIAPQYGAKEAIPTVRIQRHGRLPHTMITRFRLDGAFGSLKDERAAIEEIERWV